MSTVWRLYYMPYADKHPELLIADTRAILEKHPRAKGELVDLMRELGVIE